MKQKDASKIPGSEFNCIVIVVFATRHCRDQKYQWFKKGLNKLIRDGIPKLCPELWEIDFVSISVCEWFCSQRNYTQPLGRC